MNISYRGPELQYQQGPSGTKKVSFMQVSFSSPLLSGLSEQFADSAENKPQLCSTIKELKLKYLDDSTHLCTVGSAGERGRAANAYLHRERAKFRISQNSTSLLFLSVQARVDVLVVVFLVGDKIRFLFSPQ